MSSSLGPKTGGRNLNRFILEKENSKGEEDKGGGKKGNYVIAERSIPNISRLQVLKISFLTDPGPNTSFFFFLFLISNKRFCIRHTNKQGKAAQSSNVLPD